MLFTRELARGKAAPRVHSHALHPGIVASDVWCGLPWPIRPMVKFFMVTNEKAR